MKIGITFSRNQAEEKDVREHLLRCNYDFCPPLSSRVQIEEYARKLYTQSQRFEAWTASNLVGLVAVYCNDVVQRRAFVTNVSVVAEFQRRRVAASLMNRSIRYLRELGFDSVTLEVDSQNLRAIQLYERFGFSSFGKSAGTIVMERQLEGRL
jgi:ribosomal protein S18 acetylase RimI-like enzyme